MLYNKAFALLATFLATSVSATGSDREGPASLESAKLVTLANKAPLTFDPLVDGKNYNFNAELGYTILAVPKGGLNSVEFYVGQPPVKSEEFGAPYYLAGDNAGEVNTSAYLSTCGPKTVTIVGKAGSGAVLFTNTFSFTLLCPCVSSFTCPANAVASSTCVQSINDCTCNTGFIKSGSSCVPECSNPFTCPAFSAPNKACVQSINDCSCSSGYILKGISCVPQCVSTFTCPKDYVAIGDCIKSINDCKLECAASTRFEPKKFKQCLDKGYNCGQCVSYFEKHRSRNLQEINARHLVESNEQCSNEEYDMFLVVDGGHFAGLATPKNKRDGCPSVVFHAQAYENDDELKKIALQVHENDLVELSEDNKLHLGSKRLVDIVDAFESAPVSKGGALYDVINNNCVVMLRNMADPLDIPVDERMVGFITKKLTNRASEHIIEMMKASPALNRLYEGSRRLLKGVSTEDLLAKVIKLYA